MPGTPFEVLRRASTWLAPMPMATSIDDCRDIVLAARRAKRKYMMMETVVFSREFLYVQDIGFVWTNGEDPIS